MDIGHVPPQDRGREIGSRLDAVRARIQQLADRERGAARARGAAVFSERLEAARRHAAEAHAAAELALASSAQAFRRVAVAHERVASMYERTAASGIGDVNEHERHAAHHRAAAAADRQRAERVESLLSGPGLAGPAGLSAGPGDGVAP